MAGDDPAAQAGVAAGQQAATLGRSQIQAASAVGIGVDWGQPGLYVPSTGPFSARAFTTLVASRCWLGRFVPPKSLSVSKASFYVSTAASADDQIDIGILNSGLTTLLGSSGPVSGKLNVSPAAPVVNFQAPIALIAGQVYFLAFSTSTFGGTAAAVAHADAPNYRAIIQFAGNTSNYEAGATSGAVFPISAPIPTGSVAPAQNQPIIALIQ